MKTMCVRKSSLATPIILSYNIVISLEMMSLGLLVLVDHAPMHKKHPKSHLPMIIFEAIKTTNPTWLLLATILSTCPNLLIYYKKYCLSLAATL